MSRVDQSIDHQIHIGYQSHLAQSRLSALSKSPNDELSDFAVHFRTLGDVAYFMTSLNTPSEVLRKLEAK